MSLSEVYYILILLIWLLTIALDAAQTLVLVAPASRHWRCGFNSVTVHKEGHSSVVQLLLLWVKCITHIDRDLVVVVSFECAHAREVGATYPSTQVVFRVRSSENVGRFFRGLLKIK